MRLELGPTRKPVEACDLELRIGERCRPACSEQVLGLITQMAEIGTIRKRLWGPVWFGRHSDLLSSNRPRPHNWAERRLLRLETERWASTLSADRMRPSR